MTTTIITYMILSLCIAALLFAEIWAASKKSQSLIEITIGRGKVAILNSKLLSGIIVFVIGCWYYSSLPESNMQVFEPALSDEWSLTCLVITIAAGTTGYKAARNNSSNNLPSSLNAFSLATYLLLRIVFLVLYECFFRAVLLFVLLTELEVMPAILINTILYTLAHCYSNRKEIIGCIPFGFLLCVITLLHLSIWPAIIIHLALAMSYEITLVSNKQSSIKSHQL
jgi:membrane protease YdiL (CAAX protease family)